MEDYQNQDNWAGRSTKMICRSCIWFVPKGENPSFGRCRRHAPTMKGFVPVYDTDWCGEHRLDENKVSPNG